MMFQSFDATTSPETGGPRLGALRGEMFARSLDGFLVPRADAHQGEYVAARDMRLAWLTGFTGSAGFCIALAQAAGVFIDGRYSLQVRNQVDLQHFTPVPWPDTKPGDWIRQQLPSGGVIGFDPWLHTRDEIAKLTAELEGSKISLREVENLVDHIWVDQPGAPTNLMQPYPGELAGKSSADKRGDVAGILRDAGHSFSVLTQPDSIAWLLNTRGTDLGQTPVALAFAILGDDGRVTLFMDPAKADDTLRDHLGNAVTVAPDEDFGPALDDLKGIVRVDGNTAPLWIGNRLNEAGRKVVFERDPVTLPKACKNDAEIAGTRAAHIRDGVAVAEFLAWVAEQGPAPDLTEIDVVKKLEDCRRDTGALINISFDTICGSGPNGAIVHYRVTKASNRPIETGDVLLVDSGGQYLDGTTDITRTMAIGTPPKGAVHAFTLVLKGMIAISRQRFPKGLAGRDLDTLARAALWQEGLDYDHGTGHGVGVYLGVHEGPQRLSRLSMQELLPGMILSNEPGYYREGEFGIRIENLIIVEDAPEIAGADPREMLAFETITWAPIDRRMIDATLLSETERLWLNQYHATVLQKLGALCSPQTQAWLKTACAPM